MTTDTIIPRASRRHNPLPSLEVSDELLSYDPGTGVFRWLKSPSNNTPAGSIAGTVNANGYRVIHINGGRYRAHRLAFKMHHRREPVGEVDHIDGDPSNNRIDNLREASRSGNSQNSRLRADNISGVKGVHWHKQTGKWCVQIRSGGKVYCLGLFTDIKDATAAIRSARDHHHGEFTRHE